MGIESPTDQKTAQQSLQRPPQPHLANEGDDGQQQSQRKAGHERDVQRRFLLSDLWGALELEKQSGKRRLAPRSVGNQRIARISDAKKPSAEQQGRPSLLMPDFRPNLSNGYAD